MTKNEEFLPAIPLKFDELNKSIDMLGKVSKDLSDKEKEIGFNLLKEWEHNVLNKISSKRSELNGVIGFLTERGWYSYENDGWNDVKRKLAKVSKTDVELDKVVAAKDAVKQHELTAPQPPRIDPDKTVAENDLAIGQFELESTKWNIISKKLKYTADRLERSWKLNMRQTPEIKKLVSGIEGQLQNLTKYEEECKDKAHLARISVAISNEKAREAIKELIAFTHKI